MRGIGSEPIEVWQRDGRPERFVWRDRIYFVLFVRDTRTIPGDLASGSTAAGDSEDPGGTAALGGTAASGTAAPSERAAPGGTAAPGERAAAGETAAVGETGTVGETGARDVAAGKEVWIVEATAQRSVPATTYELCHDVASGRWTLARG